MIDRTLAAPLRALAQRHPVVTLTGPRQSGKTTLCRSVFAEHSYTSLEAPDTQDFARRDARGFLAQFPDGVVLDEVQRVPELLSYIQTLVDAAPRRAGRFILTGSQHFGLLHSIAQSLAGRTAVVHLLPLGLDELKRFPRAPADLFEVLVAGSYPAIHDRGVPPAEWLGGYTATYVERDVRQLLNVSDLVAFQTFLKLCAGRAAQLVNLSALASDCGISHNTAKAWLSVLETSFIIHRLAPLYANWRKRLVKTPKLHFYDSGLLCYLLDIRRPSDLTHHPLRGAVFESWVVSEIIKAHYHRAVRPNLSFYRDRSGLEVDAILQMANQWVAIEIRSGQTFSDDFFRALDGLSAMAAAKRRQVLNMVVYGGDALQQRSQGIVLPWLAADRFDWVEGVLR